MSLDDHIRQLSETIIGELRAPIEASLRNLFQEILATAGRERDEAIAAANARQEAAVETALDMARAEADERVAQAIAAANARQEAAIETALEAARAEADQRLEHAAALWRVEAEQQLQQSLEAVGAASETETQEALEALRSSFDADKEAALAALQSELARAHEAEMEALRESAAAEVAGAIEQARAEVAQQRDAGAAVWQAEREDLLRRHELQLVSLDEQHRAELEAARAALAGEYDAQLASVAQLAAVERDAAVKAALDQAAHDRDHAFVALEDRDEEVRAAAIRDTLVVERQADLACAERLLGAFQQLDSGKSLSEVLASLADHIGLEAGRCALLLVEGSRLRGWRLAGFPGLLPSDLDVPMEGAGVLARAVTTCEPVSTSAADDADALPALLLAPGGRAGLAVPLLVGDRAVAVLYADDAGAVRPVAPSNWPEMTEVLVRHAGRCLEVMTIARVSGPIGRRVLPPLAQPDAPRPEDPLPAPSPAVDGPDSDAERQAESAQRYARLLLSEVKLYNESAVEEGRRDGDLLARLGPEIERARRLYEEKIPAAVRERTDWFEQELVRTLAGGNAALLGQVT